MEEHHQPQAIGNKGIPGEVMAGIVDVFGFHGAHIPELGQPLGKNHVLEQIVPGLIYIRVDFVGGQGGRLEGKAYADIPTDLSQPDRFTVAQ